MVRLRSDQLLNVIQIWIQGLLKKKKILSIFCISPHIVTNENCETNSEVIMHYVEGILAFHFSFLSLSSRPFLLLPHSAFICLLSFLLAYINAVKLGKN